IQRVNATGDAQAGPTAPITPEGTVPTAPAAGPPTAPLAGLRPASGGPTRELDGIAVLRRPVGGDLDQFTELRSRVQDKLIDRIISPLGRRCDESSPMVDARLPDGSRVNVIIPPLSLTGPTITVRKFSRNPLTTDDLVNFGTLTPDMVAFLKACVESRLNVI